MRTKIYRQSKGPAELATAKQYNDEWKAFYDRAHERAMEKHKDGKFSDQYSVLMQRYCSFAERQLIRKHGMEIEIELPKTMKQWNEAIARFGGAPIAIAQLNPKGNALIIMDALE